MKSKLNFTNSPSVEDTTIIRPFNFCVHRSASSCMGRY